MALIDFHVLLGQMHKIIIPKYSTRQVVAKLLSSKSDFNVKCPSTLTCHARKTLKMFFLSMTFPGQGGPSMLVLPIGGVR